jgi:hypothetical protein
MEIIMRRKAFECVLILAYLLFMPSLFPDNERGIQLQVLKLDPKLTVGRQFLVMIAIDRYDQCMPLTNPVKDAKELKKILTERYYIDKVIELYDANATKANILKTLINLGAGVTQDDSLLIFYAGHGYLDKPTNTGFWMPVNAGTDKYEQSNWIPNTQIRGIISNIKSSHILLIADACFSGDILNTTRSAIPEINNDYFRKAYSRISRQVLTSGALETVPDESEFARQLKMCLEKNKNQYLDPLMLYNEIRLGITVTLPLFGNIKETGHQEGASFLLFLKEKNENNGVIPDVIKSNERDSGETGKMETEQPQVREFSLINAVREFGINPITEEKDDFDGTSINKKWKWVRENPKNWSLKEKTGFLEITAESGELWEYNNNNKNMLLRKPKEDHYCLDLKLEIEPKENYQQAGIIVYANDDNFLRIVNCCIDGTSIAFQVESNKVNVYDIIKRVLYLKKLPKT